MPRQWMYPHMHTILSIILFNYININYTYYIDLLMHYCLDEIRIDVISIHRHKYPAVNIELVQAISRTYSWSAARCTECC